MCSPNFWWRYPSIFWWWEIVIFCLTLNCTALDTQRFYEAAWCLSGHTTSWWGLVFAWHVCQFQLANTIRMTAVHLLFLPCSGHCIKAANSQESKSMTTIMSSPNSLSFTPWASLDWAAVQHLKVCNEQGALPKDNFQYVHRLLGMRLNWVATTERYFLLGLFLRPHLWSTGHRPLWGASREDAREGARKTPRWLNGGKGIIGWQWDFRRLGFTWA